MRVTPGSQTDCPSENALLDLVEGRLAGDEKRAAAEHLAACTACQDLAAEIARSMVPADTAPPEDATASSDAHDSTPASARDADWLPRGSEIGRYLVIDRVGAGAMGVVYAAYDPELGRKVALKLLRPDPAGAQGLGAAQRERLLREAQALARLSHPNVVAVHELATFGDQVFLAMEFVEGGTLGSWLRAAKRSQREVLDVLRKAGQGLAAAHAAGIVHRDFKPENVLVGSDGRVKVTDFGLARAARELPPAAAHTGETAAEEAPAGESAPLAATLTREGALVGTPAYMAPEQLEGKPADARSDIYGFCVAAYEALYGERPFAAKDIAELVRQRAAEKVREPPKGRRLSARLRRVLLRGLRVKPEERFQSMTSLLDALGDWPRLGARHAIAAGVLILAVFSISIALVRRADPPCTGASTAWGEVWSEAESARARDAFAKSGGSSAPAVFALVDRSFVAYRASWEAMRTDACRATRVRGEQSEALLDRRMECLEDRRREAAALARVFADADKTVVARAASAIGSLRSLESCEASKALSEQAPLPQSAEARIAIDRLKLRLAEAEALHAAGKGKESLAIAASAALAAKEIGYAPLSARLLLVRGRAEEQSLHFDDAEESYHEAAREAEQGRDDGTKIDAWTALVGLIGFRKERPAEAHQWALYAEAAIQRLGGDDQREFDLVGRVNLVTWYVEARLDEAYDGYLRQTRIAARPGVASPVQIAHTAAGMGGVLFDMGKPEEALPVFQEALARLKELLGPDSPAVDMMSLNVAEVLAVTGHPDEAIPMYRGVLAHTTYNDLGYVRHRLADALRRKGDAAAALEEDLQASALVEKTNGKEAQGSSPPLVGQGLDLLLLGRAADAIAPLERALSIRKNAKLPTNVAEVKFALARALWDGGDGGGDRARAVTLATEARDAYAAAAEKWGSALYRRLAAEASAWLASRPPR